MEPFMYNKFLRNLSKILAAIGMSALMGIVLTICVNIVARYIFRKPILWSLELCSILVVWSTYILFGLDYKEDRHFRIEVISSLLPDNLLKVLDLIVDIILLTTVVVLAISTWAAIKLNGKMILTAMPVTLLVAFYIPFIIGVTTHILFIVTKNIEKFKKNKIALPEKGGTNES
jgi:TRAP-type C4-dicarboxylate transport system permease small subunit